MKPKSLIDLEDLTADELQKIICTAGLIKNNPSAFVNSCKGKIMATLFYEPSTRTKMSFQTAMLRLGGNVIGFDNAQSSSVSKGESLRDTVSVVSNYADIIVMRNFVEGAPYAASLYSRIPVINAGDGGHLHPTQTLTDLTTLYYEKGRLDNLTVGICGDLKYGRTVHSLVRALVKYEGIRFVLISTETLSMPEYIIDTIKKHNRQFIIANSIESAIFELDVLYMTRIQRERFDSIKEYERQRGLFILDGEKLKLAKKDMIILHPLPRVDEISYEVDMDERSRYFEQTKYGMYARMALILTMLEGQNELASDNGEESDNFICKNSKCVVNSESYLPKLFYKDGPKRCCRYCDREE